MSTVRPRSTRGYPLHLTLSVAFAILIAFVGLTLIGFHYVESRRMALASAEDLIRRVDQHMSAGPQRYRGCVRCVWPSVYSGWWHTVGQGRFREPACRGGVRSPR